MDNFMDKIAQKLGAQEAIRANAAADAAQIERLEAQVAEYNACIKEIRKLSLRNAENEQKLRELIEAVKEQLKLSLEENSRQMRQLVETCGGKIEQLAEKGNTQLELLTEKGSTQLGQLTEKGSAQLEQMAEKGNVWLNQMAEECMVRMYGEEEDMQDFEHRTVYYESSRGCPFSCSYCLSSIDRAMDFRSVPQVCGELDFFLEKKVPQVKFVDRTFNCKKEHALPILRYILEQDNGVTNFHFEIAADLLDQDYFAVMERLRPGAVQLEIGVQSTCEKTISEIHRKMDFAKVASIVRRISSWQNIHIHLDLIAGLPFEDLPRFQTSFNDVYALRPQQLQLGFLKVLKGSDMERYASEYDLLYTSQPPYEVLSTRWLSYEDVCHLKQVEEMVEIYYNSGQFGNTLEFLLSCFESPYALYDSLAAWYERYGLFGVQSSRIRKYEILLEFGSACVSQDTRERNLLFSGQTRVSSPIAADMQISRLKEYLLYDLYLREHMKNRPPFAPALDPWKNAIHDIVHRESLEHTLFPELAGCNYRELTKTLHVEVFTAIFDEPMAVLFGYERRNPLTNNGITAKVPLANVPDTIYSCGQ